MESTFANAAKLLCENVYLVFDITFLTFKTFLRNLLPDFFGLYRYPTYILQTPSKFQKWEASHFNQLKLTLICKLIVEFYNKWTRNSSYILISFYISAEMQGIYLFN